MTGADAIGSSGFSYIRNYNFPYMKIYSRQTIPGTACAIFQAYAGSILKEAGKDRNTAIQSDKTQMESVQACMRSG